MGKNNRQIQSIPNRRPLVLIYYLAYISVATYVFIAVIKDLKHPSSLVQILILFGLLFTIAIFLSGRRWIMVKIRQNEQYARDQRALQFYLWVNDNKEEKQSDPYTLYLRPFTSTGHVRIALSSTVHKRGVLAGPTAGVYDPEFGRTTLYKRYVTFGDFETELADLVEKYAPLIALGRAGEQIGAGRIETDDKDWFNKFKLLVSHAKNIFLVPSTHEGTRWEIEYICNDPMLLKKTILFIPPKDTVLGHDVGPFLQIGAGKGPVGTVDLHNDAILALSQLVKGTSTVEFKKAEWGGLLQLSNHHRVRSFYVLEMTKSPSFNPTNKGSNLHVDYEGLQRKIKEYMELDGY